MFVERRFVVNSLLFVKDFDVDKEAVVESVFPPSLFTATPLLLILTKFVGYILCVVCVCVLSVVEAKLSLCFLALSLLPMLFVIL